MSMFFSFNTASHIFRVQFTKSKEPHETSANIFTASLWDKQTITIIDQLTKQVIPYTT